MASQIGAAALAEPGAEAADAAASAQVTTIPLGPILVSLELWMAVHELAQLAGLQQLVQARVHALVARPETQSSMTDPVRVS